MPTGYTADIKDGISFSTFALNCARAFGATITLRDESGGGEAIPQQFEPDSYHLRALNVARETLSTLESMTAAECDLKSAAEHTTAEIQRLSRIRYFAIHFLEYLPCAGLIDCRNPIAIADHDGIDLLGAFQETEVAVAFQRAAVDRR